MIVSASYKKPYLFRVSYNELNRFFTLFNKPVQNQQLETVTGTQTVTSIDANDGYTLGKYAAIPSVSYKGVDAGYGESKKTAVFNNAVDYLTAHGKTVVLNSQKILTIGKGLLIPSEYHLYKTNRGFEANHTPQVFGIYGGKVLIAMQGEVNLRSNKFLGSVTLIDVDHLPKVIDWIASKESGNLHLSTPDSVIPESLFESGSIISNADLFG